VKTDVIYVNTSHTPEEGAHIPSWPKGLIITIIIIIYLFFKQRAHAPWRSLGMRLGSKVYDPLKPLYDPL
jgi:hypothetical protein